jgi:hypothetical protein
MKDVTDDRRMMCALDLDMRGLGTGQYTGIWKLRRQIDQFATKAAHWTVVVTVYLQLPSTDSNALQQDQHTAPDFIHKLRNSV